MFWFWCFHKNFDTYFYNIIHYFIYEFSIDLCFSLKIDCFWLLSAFIEYACYNLLYSGFKEVNRNQLQNAYSNKHLPRRFSDSNIHNYSKIVVNEKVSKNGNLLYTYADLECKKPHLEPNFPINSIPAKSLPKKE